MSKYIPAEVRDICAEQIEHLMRTHDAHIQFSFMDRRYRLKWQTGHGWVYDQIPGQVVRWMEKKGILDHNMRLAQP